MVCSFSDERIRRKHISNALKKHFSKDLNREALSIAVSIAMQKKWQDPQWRARVVASQQKTAAEFWGFDKKRFKEELDKTIDAIPED